MLSHKISKASLKKCRVVSQVGDKFILVCCFSNSCQILMIIDQHAADERVRLERYFTILASKSFDLTSTPLDVPTTIEISQKDWDFLMIHKLSFTHFGVFYDLISFSGKYQIVITHVPEVVHAKVLSEKRVEVNMDLLKRLVIDHVRDIYNGKATSFPASHETHWTVSLRNFPDALVDIYKSKACRGKSQLINDRKSHAFPHLAS